MIIAALTTCAAQDNISGTLKCAKPDQFQKIDVGDVLGHSYAINHSSACGTKPMEIAGIQTHEGSGTEFDEMTSTGALGHGILIDTMSNGDKFTVATKGKDTYKDGKPGLGSLQGTWSFTKVPASSKESRAKAHTMANPTTRGTWCLTLRARISFPSKLRKDIFMRLGDTIDDHCSRCKRITDHAIVAMVGDDVVKVLCRTCNSEHMYPQQDRQKGTDGRTGVSKGTG